MATRTCRLARRPRGKLRREQAGSPGKGHVAHAERPERFKVTRILTSAYGFAGVASAFAIHWKQELGVLE